MPWILLGLALLIALGFEFVNGFHDTANAVATVIYTHSMPAELRRDLVGFLQFPRRAHCQRRGRLRHHVAAAGRTDPAGRLQRRFRHGVRAADRCDHLEPRHLVSRPAGFSSHTLVGSIIGVGLANQFLAPAAPTSGVDWSQATNVGMSLLISPLVGFGVAALLLLVMKLFVAQPGSL